MTESILDNQKDIEVILSKRFDNGADFWATPDHQLNIGGPFSTLESAMLLTELGMAPTDPVLKSVAALIFDCLRDDGRFKLSPSGAIYPCHTIHALKDAFRKRNTLNREPKLDQAVDFLLNHWELRMPIGPCHYGIGTLFMQVEYPFSTYNLFNYVYVLSFYNHAKTDARFLDALSVLDSKTKDGKIVALRVNRKLSGLIFCEKNKDSALGTKRYLEIKNNIILK